MPRKKLVELDEEPQEELEWDKKKLAIAGGALILLLIGGIFTKKFILDSSSVPSSTPSRSVQGVSTDNSSNASLLPSQEDVKQQIVKLEQQVSQLSVKDIASSSPQVQQVLQQLQNIPTSPSGIAKQACLNICNSL